MQNLEQFIKTRSDYNTVIIERSSLEGWAHRKTLKEIERLNKLAIRSGLEPIEVMESTEFLTDEVEYRGYLQTRYEVKVSHVMLKLNRQMIKVDGLSPVAHIDNDGIVSEIGDHVHADKDTKESTENLLREFVDDRKDNLMFCDECGKSRKRNMVLVAMGEDGKLKSFGKSCLKLMTGLSITDSLLKPVKAWKDEDEDGFSRSWSDAIRYDARFIIRIGQELIRESGYVSKREMNSTGAPSTSDQVRHIVSSHEVLRDWSMKKRPDEDPRSIIEWIENHDGTNSYMNNLKILIGLDNVKSRHIGLLVSAIASKQADDNRRAERKKFPESNHVGTVGERLYKEEHKEAEVIFLKHLHGEYGCTTLLKFRAACGALLTWFASSHLVAKAGDRCVIKGATVKAHKVYNGVSETAVNRVKLEWA